MKKGKCIVCDSKKNLISIYKKGTYCGGDEDDYSEMQICRKCVKDSEDYGLCGLCPEDVAFHMEDLSTDGFHYCCREHIQDILPEGENDGEDMESYLDYVTDPSHWPND